MKFECRKRVFCNHSRSYNHDTKACRKQQDNTTSPTHSQIVTGYHPTATPPPLMGTAAATQPAEGHNNPLFNVLDNNPPRTSTLMHTPQNGTSPAAPVDLIEGFHKFLKATIAKQLETPVEWDNLVWKATAAYNFFPTESSGLAPFFLMFGREAAVKHILLESENPKYLGMNEGMINMGLMTKLYNVVAHNLNEARKARDGKKKGTTPKELEKLKVGDNILVRDHTSKAFQPKYKDFCIVALVGKNQVEIKDNHGHITKVHRRDVKKIPMTEKVCKLYEEEQIGKTREGRKVVPNSKMPNLAWDIAETQLTQEAQKENNSNITQLLQTLVTVIILIIAIVKQTITQIKKISKKAVQAIENTTKEISRNSTIKNIKDFHRSIMSAITITTNMTDCTNHRKEARINNKTTGYSPGMRKLNNKYDESYQSLKPGPAVTATTSTTSRSTVSTRFTQRPNVEMETPEHKTLNNALVTANEVLNTTCKYSANHAPSHTPRIKSSG